MNRIDFSDKVTQSCISPNKSRFHFRGQTPLLLAASEGKSKVIQPLLAYGADVAGPLASAQGSGFRVSGLGVDRVQGFRVQVQGSGFRVQGVASRVQGFGLTSITRLVKAFRPAAPFCNEIDMFMFASPCPPALPHCMQMQDVRTKRQTRAKEHKGQTQGDHRGPKRHQPARSVFQAPAILWPFSPTQSEEALVRPKASTASVDPEPLHPKPEALAPFPACCAENAQDHEGLGPSSPIYCSM